MRITERDYDAFAEDQFPNMNLVRAWGDCKIWSAGLDEVLLVLVHNTRQHVAIFEYDTLAEREEDIQLVCHFPECEIETSLTIPEPEAREATVPAPVVSLPPKRAFGLLACFRWIRRKLSSKKART